MLNKIKKIFINTPTKIIAGLFIFYILFSYFAINPLAKRIVPWFAENKLVSHASVQKVAFDPFRLKTTIEQFKLTENNGAPLFGFEKLVVDFEVSGLLDWAWKFKEISITAPQANIAISPKGKLNWADLIAKLNEDKSPPSKTIPRVVIGLLSVKQSNVQYIDANRDTPFKAELAPLSFELERFSTLPKDRGDYLIAAKLPAQGGSLKWKGDIGVNPVASKGFIAFDHLQLVNLVNIVKNVDLPFRPSDGDIQASFSYDFSLPNDKPKITLQNIALTLNDLAGKVMPAVELSLKQASAKLPLLDFAMPANPQDKPQLNFKNLNIKFTDLSLKQGQENNQANSKVALLTLPQIDINQVDFDLAARNVNVAQILLARGAISANRNQAGVVNWQQAFVNNDVSVQQNPAIQEDKNADSVEKPFSVNIADFQLQHWLATYEDHGFVHPLNVDIADINLGFAFAMPEGNIAIHQLQSNINGLSAKSALYKTPIVTLDKLDLNQADISLANQKVDVESIQLSGLKTQVLKEANKPLNWQSILETVPNKSAKTQTVSNNKSASKQDKKPDWDLSLKKLALDNANLHFEDHSLKTPVILDVEKVAIELRDASLDQSRSLPIKAAFHVKQGGQFTAQGKFTPAPLKADLNIKLTQFALKPFAPYISQLALLKLNDGNANISGKLAVKQAKNLAVSFDGGFSVNKFSLLEEATSAPFLGWERVSSDSLSVSLAPDRVHLTELQVKNLVSKFIIHEDKSMNITRILRNQPASAVSVTNDSAKQNLTNQASETNASTVLNNTDIAKPAVQVAIVEKTPETSPVSSTKNASSTDAFPVSIDTVRIENAELEFADLSLIPQFGAHINSLSGVINGVSTSPTAIAQAELDGKVDDYGSARIRGSLQPFQATNFTDLKLSFKNLEMNRLTPYSGKFAGRRIDSGKLSVDLEYKIKQRQLAGENKFILNKLKLGEKVDSAEAANLPLDLAIAILEDSDGIIDLDLPISGSLDDPQFSYGKIVWKAIKNVLTKIITSPFRALGKLFGADADKLEAISFDAGSATLAPPEQEKLKTIQQALSKRQGLALGIIPSYDSAGDSRALQETLLRRKVAQEMGLKLDDGQKPGPIDLTNPKTQKAVDALYDTLTKKSLLKKLAAKLEKPEEGHYEEALEKLTASIVITESELQALAKSRGDAIQKGLLDAGIPAERLHIDAPTKVTADAKAINTKLTLDVAAKNNHAEPVTPATTPSSTEKVE
ncbi:MULTISPECIES: DUF748 domain-containing protein [Methylotenera]|uniref:DUF748 domain-containing protein n=1 Tax=Methylotenera TaxID=359407 RepID=UPI000362BCA8|nr:MULTISPECIES: DUF748 domain-containing protein [Methylotenera]